MARDISIEIGPLYPASGSQPKVPMYSFDRAAWIFWQGVFDGLLEKGFSEAEAFEWLQSKDTRRMLDGQTGVWLRDLGHAAASTLGRKL